MSKESRPKPGKGYARSLLAGAVLAATLFPAATAQPSDDEAIELVFKVDHRAVALADRVRGTLIAQTDKLLRRCNTDAGEQEDSVWRQALAEASSIRLRYTPPTLLKLPRREILVSEAIFSLGGYYPGSPVVHHAGRTTLIVKCSGTAVLELMCMPELATYFPEYQGRSCPFLRPK